MQNYVIIRPTKKTHLLGRSTTVSRR